MQTALSPFIALALSSLTLGGCDKVDDLTSGDDTAAISQANIQRASLPPPAATAGQTPGTGAGVDAASAAPGAVEAEGKLLVLGDSYSLSKLWRAAFEREFPNLNITYDSVGGSSLAQQLERLKRNPETKGWPLLILDGGLTDFKPEETIADIVEFQDAKCDLWFYVEPVKRGYTAPNIQKRRHRVIDRVGLHFEQQYPGHLIKWNEELRGQAVGTQQDKFDLSDGIMPSSLRADNVHLNEQGYGMLAAIIAREIRQSQLGADCSE